MKHHWSASDARVQHKEDAFVRPTDMLLLAAFPRLEQYLFLSYCSLVSILSSSEGIAARPVCLQMGQSQETTDRRGTQHASFSREVVWFCTRMIE